jgi:hypothetical protein
MGISRFSDRQQANMTAARSVLHHAVLGPDDAGTASIARLRDVTQGGDYAYYVDIAHFMAALSLSSASAARWLDGEQPSRSRWRTLVTARHEDLCTAR